MYAVISQTSLTLLWDKADHNAFTDLCHFNDALYCCFREATTHVSPDGVIRVLQLDSSLRVINSQRVSLPLTDLRDPKLSVAPDGKLTLIAWARRYKANKKIVYSQTHCWFSGDGQSWSSPRPIGDKGWWLWRIRWHQQIAWGFGYRRASNAVHLYRGVPRRTFERYSENVLSYETHKLGYPNESDLCFIGDAAYAIVRRDAGSCSAQLGISKPPFRQWKWTDLQEYIGGPNMVPLNNTSALISGRRWDGERMQTAIWLLSLKTQKLKVLDVLPSQGDNSYPGMVLKDNTLFVCYYSSHVENKSNIFITTYDVDPVTAC